MAVLEQKGNMCTILCIQDMPALKTLATVTSWCHCNNCNYNTHVTIVNTKNKQRQQFTKQSPISYSPRNLPDITDMDI